MCLCGNVLSTSGGYDTEAFSENQIELSKDINEIIQ
jgi:hypothetical protein